MQSHVGNICQKKCCQLSITPCFVTNKVLHFAVKHPPLHEIVARCIVKVNNAVGCTTAWLLYAKGDFNFKKIIPNTTSLKSTKNAVLKILDFVKNI